MLVFYIRRIGRKNAEQDRHDVGTAILEFGRAFPGEAIRSLHITANGNAVFVRLHENKTGFMRNRNNHYACNLVQPGRVRLVPHADAKGFSAEFLDAPIQNGDFVFASEREAAEVSLWLLDNYASVIDHEEEQRHGEPSHDGKPATDTEMAVAEGSPVNPDRAN
ncbi:hypothetical protein [Neorhizobium sp. NCHU2750]|uniref:hypothetical protein n=1 Tax=Neorhizobium sp. NCHU2750 TaxID=1825976 RepID=UPI001FDF08E6